MELALLAHIFYRFSKENCQITVLDNLHSGNRTNIPEGVNFIEMDICDEKRIIDVFEKNKFGQWFDYSSQQW